MKKLFLLLSAAAFSTLLAVEQPSESASVKGKVNVTDFLNVRLGPGLRHPVMGRLNPDQEVEITRISGNWLELKAPENLKIYVSEARVDAEGKLSGELNMRSRMDVAAPTYGILPKGSVVKRLDERRNGWVRIAPPESIRIYVAAICVKFDRSKFADNGLPLTAAKAAETEKTEAPKAAEAEKTEAKAVVEVKAPEVNEAPKTVEAVKTEAKAVVEVKAPEAKAEAPKAAAPAIPPVATAAPLKQMTGVAVKWQYAKSEETAIAFLDQPNGKNQAFITGKTPEIQKELLKLVDSGKSFEISGDYKAVKTPPVFEVSVIKIK